MIREGLIEKLKNDIDRGHAVIIAGTGVSMAACRNQIVDGYPVATWQGLLQHGVEYCKSLGAADQDSADVLTIQIKSGKTHFLISAAEFISDALIGRSEGTFRGWLKDTVGRLSVQDQAVIDALHFLPGILATLSYDHLIEKATARQPVTWLEADKTQDVLLGVISDGVLHLHGSFDKPDSVVLGLKSYVAVRDQPHARAVLDLFTIDRTVLFVGCCDTVLDPNFTRLLDWAKTALSDVSPRHILLCRTAEAARFQDKLADAPWLQPLPYGDNYDDLAPFLRSLAPIIRTVTSLKARIAPPFDLEPYQNAMRRRHGRLKLEELDATTSSCANTADFGRTDKSRASLIISTAA